MTREEIAVRFATAMLQGVTSINVDPCYIEVMQQNIAAIPKTAVSFADAIIRELEREQS